MPKSQFCRAFNLQDAVTSHHHEDPVVSSSDAPLQGEDTRLSREELIGIVKNRQEMLAKLHEGNRHRLLLRQS